MTKQSEICQKIKHLMSENKVSYGELENELGISKSKLSKVVNQQLTDIETLKEVCKYFGIEYIEIDYNKLINSLNKCDSNDILTFINLVSDKIESGESLSTIIDKLS